MDLIANCNDMLRATSLLAGRNALIVVNSAATLYLCVNLFGYSYKSKSRRSAVNPQSPPGPPGLPVLGNELQVPNDKQWLCFDEWASRYGVFALQCNFNYFSLNI